ncbi:hypothetical protein BH20ACT18_BH20ACT18_01130 [soil metagenome]
MLIVAVGVLVLDLALRDSAAPRPETTGPVNPPPSPIISPPPRDRGAVAPVSRAELAAAQRAARRFLDGYLAFLYGRAPARRISGVTAAVRHELERNTPRIPPAQRDRTPRVVNLNVTGQARDAVIATASVDDGDIAVYPIVFTLDRYRDGWRVSRLATD